MSRGDFYAFPHPEEKDANGDFVHFAGQGLTVREYAAVHLLAGIMASGAKSKNTTETGETVADYFADQAVFLADALLARLSK